MKNKFILFSFLLRLVFISGLNSEILLFSRFVLFLVSIFPLFILTNCPSSHAALLRYIAKSMASAFRAFLNSPVGPKTTHFWGPIANWGFVIAGLVDTQKPPEMISGNMTGAMCLYQLSRWAKAQGYLQKKETDAEKLITNNPRNQD
ncbi:hypothetical protein J5N97_001382 [Dioscorea zingiberensis]|uniref:Mitochondrial pyruvate carrier n=1 Tax=Dioscorea zingiberensis TaxID=325984 RepID=A0A9D5BU31_9LILI|nr:hypothetical protein J5N97_001382 [Dioscorea zingiberensis]